MQGCRTKLTTHTARAKNVEVTLHAPPHAAVKYALPPVRRTNKKEVFLFTSFVASAKEEVRMGKLPLIIAVTSAMWALPASAQGEGNAIPSKPAVTLAQLDFCIGPDCQRAYRERRYYDRYDDDSRYRYDDDWRYRRGCREVTIRERRGDEIVVRRVHRCD
jgi:hypothetical protein